MQDHSAKFEQGVSADPTKNMSKTDAAEWERQNALHRNEFTASAKGLLPSEAARLRDAGLAPKTAARDDSTFVPFPDFWLLPGAVKMKMKQKIEGVGLRFTPHRDGVELHAPLPATPADKQNLAYAVQVLEEGVRNRPAKTAAGLMTPHGRAPLIAPGDVTRWDSVEVESKDGGRTFAVVAYGRTAESKREVRSVLAFGYKDADQARKEADTYRMKLRVRTAAHRLDGVRGHQLLPATVARKLPAIYSQENVDDPVALVKLFSPYSGAVWYLTEYDPSSKRAFGWADLGMGGGELGYIDITELEGLNRRGLPLVERDLYWKPMPLSRAKHSRTASKAARYDRGPLSPDEKAELFEGNPEFKDMNENPPETVLAIRRQMEKQAFAGVVTSPEVLRFMQELGRVPGVQAVDVADIWHDGYHLLQVKVEPKESRNAVGGWSNKTIEFAVSASRYGKFFNLPDYPKVIMAVRALAKRSGLTVESLEGPKKVYEYQDPRYRMTKEPRISGYDGNSIMIAVYA